MWLLDLFFKLLIIWLSGKLLYNDYVKSDFLLKGDRNESSLKGDQDNQNNQDSIISKEYIHDNKKISYLSPNYDIEKVYAIKFNLISKHCPQNNLNLETGYIWFNTGNNTINIYNNNTWNSFPILNKSIIKQYIKRQDKLNNNKKVS